ncbi:LysR family transcriptional regulator [Luteipulveratus mongoliensis]|uniref:LysR family transcriptional regulator n=1 Tax=Luteipulveratus mongoliensis TaxID=571913 RepID=A0A0K1JKR1_9MICO|nr:LysR family transcriptional regulator [Luteipulveratus mongoliensis]AKU17297.1 LysR family transcriptional regulator [Luteipulveratus mongoliensis]
MNSSPSVDDLRLVLAVRRAGSVGSAARELGSSQPSASQRLARIERRCGTVLFDRDTTGARPTAAGLEMARQAEHILGHLEGVYASTAAATEERPLVIGTFASLAASVLPALDELLPDVSIEQRFDHGNRMIEWVAEGTMDATFVAIVEQVTLPRRVLVHPVGADRLVLFRPAAATPAGRGRWPFKGRAVVYSTYDLGSAQLQARLESLGATARRGVTMPTTLAMARRRGHLAVVPQSAIARDLRDGEAIDRLPFTSRLRLSMVTGREPDPRLVRVLPTLRRDLGLTPVRAPAR